MIKKKQYDGKCQLLGKKKPRIEMEARPGGDSKLTNNLKPNQNYEEKNKIDEKRIAYSLCGVVAF